MSEPLPTIFLDRDGTIIVEKHYLSDPAHVELEAGAAQGLKLLCDLGLTLVVVSNQSGIGRGKFGLEAAHAVNARVAELLAEHGVTIAGWYMCPHAPGTDCSCRKPLPGMARQAHEELGVPLQGAYVIGDKRIDVELGHAIGGSGLLVTTGHGREDEAWANSQQVPVFDGLLSASQHIHAQLNQARATQP
jgi:D-glycero-D-manno-heptose 1,7-bisphosphate phosphatase